VITTLCLQNSEFSACKQAINQFVNRQY